jgi:hypothetical protein
LQIILREEKNQSTIFFHSQFQNIIFWIELMYGSKNTTKLYCTKLPHKYSSSVWIWLDLRPDFLNFKKVNYTQPICITIVFRDTLSQHTKKCFTWYEIVIFNVQQTLPNTSALCSHAVLCVKAVSNKLKLELFANKKKLFVLHKFIRKVMWKIIFLVSSLVIL